jgi:hypothetical protein
MTCSCDPCAFTPQVCAGTFGVVNRKKADKLAQLRQLQFPTLDELRAQVIGEAGIDLASDHESDDGGGEEEEQKKKDDVATQGIKPDANAEKPKAKKTGFEYLLSQSLTNLDDDEIVQLHARHLEAQEELARTEAEPIKDIWRRDLERLVFEYNAYEAQRKADLSAHDAEDSDDNKNTDDAENGGGDKKSSKVKKSAGKATSTKSKPTSKKRKRAGEEDEQEVSSVDILSLLQVELVPQVLPALPEKKKRKPKADVVVVAQPGAAPVVAALPVMIEVDEDEADE